MQGSSSDSSTFIDLLTQFGGQNVQDHPDRNQNNAKNDISETLQNKSNLSAEQKEALSQFFLELVLSLFQSTAKPKHEEGIHQLKQTTQKETLRGAATAPSQNMQNVSSICIIRTLSAAEQNAILMQDEDEFGIEKFKGFKSKKAFIYIKKNIYELESWIYTCENAFFLRGFQKNLIRVHWAN